VGHQAYSASMRPRDHHVAALNVDARVSQGRMPAAQEGRLDLRCASCGFHQDLEDVCVVLRVEEGEEGAVASQVTVLRGPVNERRGGERIEVPPTGLAGRMMRPNPATVHRRQFGAGLSNMPWALCLRAQPKSRAYSAREICGVRLPFPAFLPPSLSEVATGATYVWRRNQSCRSRASYPLRPRSRSGGTSRFKYHEISVILDPSRSGFLLMLGVKETCVLPGKKSRVPPVSAV
jgi:hypothetical protein